MRTEEILANGGTQLCRLEAAFTLLAEEVPASGLMRMLDDLVLAVRPSLLEERAQRGRDKAGLSISRKDDGSGWYVEADLDLECGERLFTALASELRRDPANVSDTAVADELREEGIEWWAGEGDEARRPRSKRERMHDALNRLLGRYLEHGFGGTHHKTPVQINVTIEAPAIDDEPGAMPGAGDSGASIPRSMIRRWWCDSGITAFILSRGGRALRSVHGGRTLSAVERRAVLIEHGNRCAGIGCCSPTDPTVALRPHHSRRFADDGVTSLEETVLACDVLHQDIHEGGKTVRLRDGRYLNEQGWVDGPPWEEVGQGEPPF
jgi:hypothetical protein